MFIKDRNFKIKLNLNHICIPYVDNKTSDNLFQDGRIFGLIAENIIANFFGLDKMYGCNDYDLKSNEGLKYEVKTLTKQGLKTCPSYMIGKGREYNIEEHKKYLCNKDGFFIVDNTNFPILKIYYIKDTLNLLFKSLSHKKATQLLNEMTEIA